MFQKPNELYTVYIADSIRFTSGFFFCLSNTVGLPTHNSCALTHLPGKQRGLLSLLYLQSLQHTEKIPEPASSR